MSVQAYRVSVPRMRGNSAGSPISPATPRDMGAIFSPTAPAELTSDTHAIGIPDVSDQHLHEYMQITPEPNQALLYARIDVIWKQVAVEYRILTGDKKHDQMLWEDHHLYMQGAIDEDPISHDGDARDEFLRRVMQLMGGE